MYSFDLLSAQVSLDSVVDVSIDRLLCASVIRLFSLHFIYFNRCQRAFSYISYL